MRPEIEKIQKMMEAAEYVTDAPVATSVHLALSLRKPLLIEGHAGVGKTEVAKVMSRVLGTNLIRLQCYEGLDASTALYEWNYQKQLLHIKLAETRSGHSVAEEEHEIFSEPFLLRRPLLQAISQDRSPVLLVDEVDRCVAAGTLIQTPAGIKRADEVQVGDELIGFDPTAFRLTTSRVKKVVPHHATHLIRLIVGGRLVEVTPEHRFVRFSNKSYEVVQAADLRVGDQIPLHKGSASRAIEPDLEFGEAIVKLTEEKKRMLHAAYASSGKTYQQIAARIGISRNHLRNVIQPASCRESLRARVLEGLVRELEIDQPKVGSDGAVDVVRQTVAFYELLGYIVADGCFTSDRLCLADKDRENVEVYAKKVSEAFGAHPRIVRGPHRNYELTLHSLPLGRFLRRVLGPGMVRSRERRVPSFVFDLPAAKMAGFVRGYFDGEGWVGDHQVAVSSASPYLLVGVQHLLSILGVDSQMCPKTGRTSLGGGPFFTLSVTDVERFAEAVGFCSPAKARHLSEKRSPRWTKTETLPQFLIEKPLRSVCEGGVLNGRPSHQTVYDILGGRVRPNVSALRRVAECFASTDLGELLQRGVVLGAITFIETVAAPQTVYDFVLDGHPYFVGNQVVMHNCDEEFEAFMLEVFAEWQVTIPEIGTIKATHPPHVILTSNRTRELSDALRRRCLYLWIDYPTFEKEVRIVELKVPGINRRLAAEITRFMEALRRMRLSKVPGVAETLDWAQALAALHADHLDEALVAETLGCVLKDAEDIKRFRAEVARAGLTPFVPVQP